MADENIEDEVIDTETSEQDDESPEFSEEEAAAIQAEVDRREAVIHDIVNAAIDGKPVEFMDTFDQEIKHRLSHVIAQDKIDIKSSMVGGEPVEYEGEEESEDNNVIQDNDETENE